MSWTIEIENYDDIVNVLQPLGYKKHHTALRRGYRGRKAGYIVEKYSGRFGDGAIIVHPNTPKTNGYYDIEYWIS